VYLTFSIRIGTFHQDGDEVEGFWWVAMSLRRSAVFKKPSLKEAGKHNLLDAAWLKRLRPVVHPSPLVHNFTGSVSPQAISHPTHGIKIQCPLESTTLSNPLPLLNPLLI
jgi:hypothetical protein